MLVVSPLWFLAVYLMLIALLPLFLWLHERFDTVVLVFMVGIAGAVDIVRFRHDLEWLGLVNMVVVWGLCHQLGFFYDRIVAAARRTDWTLLWGGLFGLAGLVGSGLYPGLDGRRPRRAVEHGAADAVHRRARAVPGRRGRGAAAVDGAAARATAMGACHAR